MNNKNYYELLLASTLQDDFFPPRTAKKVIVDPRCGHERDKFRNSYGLSSLLKEAIDMIELLSEHECMATVESYFGFRETPFGVTPDPRFFYSSSLYLEGLAALVYGIRGKKGLMLLTGEVGTGKTILLRKLMRQL